MNEENEKLRELVFMAIGEASMCWSEVPSGVFESTRAKKIGDKLMEGISRHQSNPIDPDYAEFKAWKSRGETEAKGSCPYIEDVDCVGCPHCVDCTRPEISESSLAPKPEAKTEEGLREELKMWCVTNPSGPATKGDAFEEGWNEGVNFATRDVSDILSRHPATLEPLAKEDK